MRSPSQGFEQFRALVERDTSLQERFDRPDDPAVLIELVIAAAREHGLSLDTAELAAAISANRRVLADERDARLPPRGWLPVRTRWRDHELIVDWAYLGSRRLLEPFFDDSVRLCLSKPFNRLFRYATPIDVLAGWQTQHPGLPPTGFIFHMSRCGSTLAAQMLAAIPQNIVISEAGPIDAVVQARHQRPDLGDEQHAAWLRRIVGALGQPRSGAEQHLFVKLDSWHALALPLFRRAFPKVPWIFLYRDPLEILVSQLKQRGMHMVPGLIGHHLFGETSQPTAAPETHCAEVLQRIGEAVLRDYALGRALLVNYNELPAALWSTVLLHVGVPCNADDRAAMADASRYDAKNPDLSFAADTAAKRHAATDPIRAAAERLGGLHARLESLRLSGREPQRSTSHRAS